MYNISINPNAWGDLNYLRKFDRTRILRAINILANDPISVTNDKRILRPNNIAERELKIGNFRAFYNIDENTKEVEIISVGWKVHNKLYVRGKETPL
jgi:mRNA-degrading endonuclease RelE of RelBE toxin-antitoxin system